MKLIEKLIPALRSAISSKRSKKAVVLARFKLELELNFLKIVIYHGIPVKTIELNEIVFVVEDFHHVGDKNFEIKFSLFDTYVSWSSHFSLNEIYKVLEKASVFQEEKDLWVKLLNWEKCFNELENISQFESFPIQDLLLLCDRAEEETNLSEIAKILLENANYDVSSNVFQNENVSSKGDFTEGTLLPELQRKNNYGIEAA